MPSPVEIVVEEAQLKPLQELERIVSELSDDNGELRESLASVSQMLAYEDRGWTKIIGAVDDEGIDLDELKEASAKIREMIVTNPTIKQGANLRSTYVWSKGVRLGGFQTGRGRTNVQNLIDQPVNQANVFGAEAQEALERAAFSEGNIILLGDNRTKELRAIPLTEISDVLRNPNFSSEVWAYRRTWVDYSGTQPVPRVKWYYTDTYTGPKGQSKTYNGKREQFDNSYTIINQHFNTQIGWAWGVPDALPVIAYARLYRDSVLNGYRVSEAMAAILFKATAKSKAGVQDTGLKLSQARGAGNTAVMSDGNDMNALSTSGKAYDYSALTPLAALVSAGLGISTTALTTNAADAGGSYGSAASLDLPTRLTMESRQSVWKSFYVRVLKWMGVQNPTVEFESLLEGQDLLRAMQAVQLLWNSGLYSPTEAKEKFEAIQGVSSGNVPDPYRNVLVPNNKDSVARSDIDTDVPGTASSGNGQGQSTGTGDIPTGSDTRDTIS